MFHTVEYSHGTDDGYWGGRPRFGDHPISKPKPPPSIGAEPARLEGGHRRNTKFTVEPPGTPKLSSDFEMFGAPAPQYPSSVPWEYSTVWNMNIFHVYNLFIFHIHILFT